MVMGTSAIVEGDFKKIHPKRPASISTGDTQTDGEQAQKKDEILQADLNKNIDALKDTYNKFSMYLPQEWQEPVFRRIESMLDFETWEEDGSKLDIASFTTFLRFVAFTQSKKIPSLGISGAGNLLVSWQTGHKIINLEFLGNDQANAILTQPTPRAREIISWSNLIGELKEFLERVGYVECLS
jgi:hypothetical protein